MLVTILVVILLLALALYGVSLLSGKLDGRLILILQVVLVVIAMVYIAQTAGIV